MSLDRRPVLLYGTLFALGVAAGGVELATDADTSTSAAGVATANWVHVGLAAVALALLAVARRRDRAATTAFLRRPLTAAGWADWFDGLTWRGRPVLLRPLVFLGVVLMAYTPLRAGEQVMAGLDRDFTRDAWGGPTYLGAMGAHYLDGVLIFLAGAALARATRRRRAAVLAGR
ncbi:MAG TPA: hypothetical protein VLM05_12855 [Mycobacteriales bacterium]|nr:hypothetical protein [Mycobacteriales bacterium]